jgi:hypothetical protein
MKKVGFKGGKMEKIVSLLVVFSLLGLTGNLLAGERRGAILVVQKKDGTQVKGELIAVKQNSILLLGSSSGTDISIDVPDITTITIIKKSRALSGLGLGLLIGGGAGAGIGFASGNDRPGFFSFTAGEKAALFGGALAVTGGVIGLIAGASAGTDHIIQIEGKNTSTVEAVLSSLKPKARVPDSR